eukprot:TRINITY_DN7607_c0_g1_i1.p1 TRINITY_DN7607_c0_g1~~TRINITY_DN7607_c0_g1_i1.p1  ORF type:complete len:364 (-),score=82.40 TRINITY_DN7607_c0_g1_i1:100-1191(-)
MAQAETPGPQMAQLDDACLELLSRLSPPPNTSEVAEQLRRSVEQAVNGTGLLVQQATIFGSIGCGLASGSGWDVDVCVQIDHAHPEDLNAARQLPGTSLKKTVERHTLNRAGGGLRKTGWVVDPVLSARVPVLKCESPEGVQVDVVVNHTEGIHNTELLRSLVQTDCRFQQLALLIKHWASRRGIRNPSDGYFSSYCLTLMVIHYLQQRPHALLPVIGADLQEPPNTEATIGELLAGFFELHANPSTKKRVVSLVTDKFVHKKRKGWEWARSRYCVEDPLLPEIDTAATVQHEQAKMIDQEFQRAWDIMGSFLFQQHRQSGEEMESNAGGGQLADSTLDQLLSQYEPQDYCCLLYTSPSPRDS